MTADNTRTGPTRLTLAVQAPLKKQKRKKTKQ